MMITASALGVLTLAGWITAPLLLLLTFSLGVGTAMTMPAWGAIVPELITRPQLPAAIALNSVGMNISRTVGPALAGVIVAATGPGAVFCLNALSFLAVLLALRSWQRPPRKSDLPAERLIGAIRAGLRYARHSPELRAVLTRGIGFFVFASASWALLPLIVRQELASGPGTYGAFLACLGVGAVCGARRGQAASRRGIPIALTLAAIGALVGRRTTWRLRIGRHDVADLTPSMHWPTPMADGLGLDRGPVMVTVEYRIDTARLREVARNMQQIRRIRRRDGAFMWELFGDVEDPGRQIECFMVESWIEHLRQHERVTFADRDISYQALAFHLGDGPPKVTHLVADGAAWRV